MFSLLSGCETDREEHLEELVTRLENVTKRLEDIPVRLNAVLTQEAAVQTQSPSPKRFDRSSTDTPSVESVVEVGSPDSPERSFTVVMSVANFEDLLAGPVAEFLQLSQKIGGDVAAHSKLVEKAFQ